LIQTGYAYSHLIKDNMTGFALKPDIYMRVIAWG